MSAVAASALTVTRGGREILHDLSFTVESGEITGLLGPSGCGKSTLMRAIVGVQAHVAGSLTVLGAPAGSAALRSRIGYLTQAASVYDDLTVAENLRFFARVLGVGAGAVDRAVSTVGLEGEAGRVVHTLSGGQRSRVSLAIALLAEPDLLVLDEPTVGLDPVLRQELWSTFRSLADAGAALIVSSHVMDEAEHCDRLLLMREGAFLADGSPSQITRDGESVEDAFLRLVRE